jgi:hypothetical protein
LLIARAAHRPTTSIVHRDADWRVPALAGGKNIVRGYARWCVDLVCALVELRMLGVAIDAEYEQRVRSTIAVRAEARARWRAAKTNPPEIEWPDDWPVEWIPNGEENVTFDETPF